MNEQPYNDHNANREPFRKARGENRHERRARAAQERRARGHSLHVGRVVDAAVIAPTNPSDV